MSPEDHEIPFVDIHCHLLPEIDDGARTQNESLAMAQLAYDDGTQVIIATPHQLGNFAQNSPALIRSRTAELQQFLRRKGTKLLVLPGADVRVEDDLVRRVRQGEVLTLADRGRHLLLELPHELYFDLVPLVRQLDSLGIQAILSHPERNMGLLAQPHAVEALVSQGCLIQVTCGSLTGTFGTASEKMSEWLLSRGLVHFLASDGHGVKARRPKMAKAYHKATNLVGDNLAREICAANPADVTLGRTIKPGKRSVAARSRGGWFARRRVG